MTNDSRQGLIQAHKQLWGMLAVSVLICSCTLSPLDIQQWKLTTVFRLVAFRCTAGGEELTPSAGMVGAVAVSVGDLDCLLIFTQLQKPEQAVSVATGL